MVTVEWWLGEARQYLLVRDRAAGVDIREAALDVSEKSEALHDILYGRILWEMLDGSLDELLGGTSGHISSGIR